MQKAAGMILIVAAAAGMGFSKSLELVRRERNLRGILRMVVLLKGEIRYGNASLHDAFLGVSGKLTGELSDFLRETAERMQASAGVPFGELFRRCAEEKLDGFILSAEEREAFFSLGGHLGYLDLAMQLKQLEVYEEELETSVKKLRGELPEKKKIYQSLGVMGGLLLALLVW